MNLNLLKPVSKLISDNSTTILTAIAVVGTATTGVLAARGGIKAQQVLAQADEDFGRGDVRLQTKLTWTCYVPAVASGAGTIAAIVCANRISAGRVAAMAGAYSLSESKLKEYKTAVEKKFGIETKQELDKDVAKQQASQAVPVERQPQRPIIISGDKQLFFDIYSGRYFEASMEDLRSAENDMNYKVIQDMQCPLSYFYEVIGLPGIALGDDWGWNATCPPDFKYSPNIDDNTGKACIWVDFDVEPLREWNHLEP